jgi:uncharacterized protein (DUF1015 family)
VPTLFSPFAALRPAPGREADVIAPPYDVLSEDEARARVVGRPWSFLHVSRPEVDLLPGTDAHAPEAYAKTRETMRRMIAEGVLKRDPAPAYYAYRITKDHHTQTGVAAAAAVVAYETGRIRRHELTRPAKEMDRVRQIQAAEAHTGLVFLTHRPSTEVTETLSAATAGAPATDATADDGGRHQLWPITEAGAIERITRAFEAMATLYVADGHHRAGAAVRVAAERRSAANMGGPAADDRFLVVSFSADEVRILDYNRIVRDLLGRSAAAFLAEVAARCVVEPLPGPARPTARHEVSMLLDGRWHRLRLPAPAAGAGVVDRLDVTLLHHHVLEPILGIGDARTDPRLDFVGGIRGLADLEERVGSGEWAVAFALHPTSLDDLMAVADADQLMPPKSTWFEPKLADGLISLPLY